MELWLSSTFVLFGWLIATRKTRTIRILIKANLWISVFDLINYWLFFRRNEYFLGGEGMIMAVATVLIFFYAPTSYKNEKTG